MYSESNSHSNRYHGNERMTEELSQRLLQLTPSLYSADDAKRAKAEECLSLASDLSGDPTLKVLSVPVYSSILICVPGLSSYL